MSRICRTTAFTLCTVAAVCLTSGIDAQSKRPMTVDDLLSAIRVGDPQLSPDGRTVLFVRTTTALDSGKRNADIWTVPADGSAPPALLIGGDGGETSPRFFPDGTHIAFISTRDGAPQLYVADAQGHGVKRATKVSGGVQPPVVISPDGTKVVFVADVYPPCTDDPCNQRAREALDKDPVKAHRLTRLPFRHWDEWREHVRHHLFVASVATGETHDITPGDIDSPPHSYEDDSVAFAPDGRDVAFVSKREGPDREMWSTNHDVWIVSAAGDAKATRVTTNPAADMQPEFSPAGPLLAVRAQRRPGHESDRWFLDVYDRVSGTKRTLFESPDLSVADYRFSPDGRSIWFTASDHAADNLYTVPVAGGAPTLVAKGGSIAAVRTGAGFAVFSKSTLTAPAELFRVSADGTGVVALTRENAAWLGAVEMPRPETRIVTGAGGAAIQYWILTPPGFDATKKYPVVFLIHGGPQGEWGDAWSFRWNLSLWASQGWIVVAPNPRGSTGFGQRFVDEISQDWCGKVMADLDAVFDTAARLPYVDTARTGIAGASYGGYAVNWIIGHTDRFRAAVSHDGVFNLESMALATEELWFSEWEFGGPPWSAIARQNFARCSPHLAADRIKTPTLVITNELDFRVPVDQGLQLFTALRRGGVAAEALVFPDEGHWVLKALNSRRWHDAVFAWINKHLPN